MAKVVRFHAVGAPDVLRLEEVPEGPLPPGAVRIDVRAVGLNRADVLFRTGAYLQAYTWPSRIGFEASGVVKEIGANVKGFALGDAVSVVPGRMQLATSGTYGETVDVPAARLVHNPTTLSHVDAAATWMQYVTAYGGLCDAAAVKPGDVVLITAPSSSVGIAAIQICKMLGAKPVAITTSMQKKAALLDLGAIAVLSAADENLVRSVHELSGGLGAKVIFDAVGGPGVVRLHEAAMRGATHVIYGLLDPANAEFSPLALLAKGITIRGYEIYETTDDDARRASVVGAILSGLSSGALKPVVAQTFAIEDVAQSHHYLESNQQIGKVVLTV